MATVEFYSKTQVDARVPDPSSASVGDVLTIGSGGPEWATGGGGSGVTITDITNATQLDDWLLNANPGDMLIANGLTGAGNVSVSGLIATVFANSTIVFMSASFTFYTDATHPHPGGGFIPYLKASKAFNPRYFSSISATTDYGYSFTPTGFNNVIGIKFS